MKFFVGEIVRPAPGLPVVNGIYSRGVVVEVSDAAVTVEWSTDSLRQNCSRIPSKVITYLADAPDEPWRRNTLDKIAHYPIGDEVMWARKDGVLTGLRSESGWAVGLTGYGKVRVITNGPRPADHGPACHLCSAYAERRRVRARNILWGTMRSSVHAPIYVREADGDEWACTQGFHGPRLASS